MAARRRTQPVRSDTRQQTQGKNKPRPGTGQTTVPRPGGGTTVTTPIVGAHPGPAPAPVDAFWNWLASNPSYLTFNPIYQQQLGDLFAQYGYVPTLDARGNISGFKTTAGQPNIDYATNPFSVLNQLRRQTGTNAQNIQDAANQRGVLYSGVHEAMQLHEQQAYAQRLADAQSTFKNALGTLMQGESQRISDLYPTYLQTAPPSGTPGTTGTTGTTGGSGAPAGSSYTATTPRYTQSQLNRRLASRMRPPRPPKPALPTLR